MYIYRKGILIIANLHECRRLVAQNKSRAAHQQCEYLQTWERKVISTVWYCCLDINLWLNTWSITKWSHDMEGADKSCNQSVLMMLQFQVIRFCLEFDQNRNPGIEGKIACGYYGWVRKLNMHGSISTNSLRSAMFLVWQLA